MPTSNPTRVRQKDYGDSGCQPSAFSLQLLAAETGILLLIYARSVDGAVAAISLATR